MTVTVTERDGGGDAEVTDLDKVEIGSFRYFPQKVALSSTFRYFPRISAQPLDFRQSEWIP